MKYLNRAHRTALAVVLMTAALEGSAGGAPAENAAPEATAPVPKAPGVGDVAKQLIRDGLGNKEVLAEVQKQFPDAKTTMASVNWYRNHLRGLGENVKTARELAQVGKPTAEEVAAAKQAKKDEAKAEREKKAAEKKAAKQAEKDAAKQAKKDADAAAKAAAAPADQAGANQAGATDGEQGEGFLA